MTTDRRSFVKTALGAAALAPALAAAQAQGPRDWSEQNPVRYPDADIVVLDKRFAKYKLGGTSIHRLYTGMLEPEGPAWNGVGKYLLFSDIPNDRQMRCLVADASVTTCGNPST